MAENRSRRRDPERRRREILTAAVELTVEYGSAALTHRAIAARAGVPLGSTTQYFASIDELREAALQQLADEVDRTLEELEPFVAHILTEPERALSGFVEYLHDHRTVRADIALMTAGTTDPRLRSLALQWSNRLIEMLEGHVGRSRAIAISVYLDGATMHSGLHDEPLGGDELARAIRALAAMPDTDEGPTDSARPTKSDNAPGASHSPSARTSSTQAHTAITPKDSGS